MSAPPYQPMSMRTYTEIRGLPPALLAFLAGVWLGVGFLLTIWLARHL